MGRKNLGRKMEENQRRWIMDLIKVQEDAVQEHVRTEIAFTFVWETRFPSTRKWSE
jgi:hypothetical protein